MGKGDQRSRRGKIWRGTFGRRRPKKGKNTSPVVTETAVIEKKSKKPAATSEQT